MTKYMVVYTVDGSPGASFKDTYEEARNAKMDIECGLGGYAEIYGREEYEDGNMPPEYILLEA